MKEEIKGTIVEMSLREVLSMMLSDYASNLKRNGEKIFVTGDDFTSTIDMTGYLNSINEIFTDDNIRLSASKETLKDHILALEELDKMMGEKYQGYDEKNKVYAVIQYCMRLMKRNLL